MKLENNLCMATGNGEYSYAANSRIANKTILQNMPLLQKAIEEVCTSLSPGSTMVVADLGCSSGPNTLLLVAEVIGIISDCNQNTDKKGAFEVQFFLNDLPSNDFNLVFQMLDQFQNKLNTKDEGKETTMTPLYYVAGLPGSFYKRLFPCKSVHIFHSSYSLQWLSKVPDELLSGNCINEGNIHIGKTTSHSVINLFREQFQMDFELFLTLRSKELVSGGRMLLTILGRKSEEMLTHGEIGTAWELLSESLRSLVLKGRVEKEKLDSFNMPLYAPSLDEVKAVLYHTELFAVEHMGLVEFNWDPEDDNLDDHMVSDPASSGTNVAKAIRAVLEPLIAGHFGDNIIDDLFAVYASIVAKHLEEAGNAKCGSIVVSLKKAMH